MKEYGQWPTDWHSLVRGYAVQIPFHYFMAYMYIFQQASYLPPMQLLTRMSWVPGESLRRVQGCPPLESYHQINRFMAKQENNGFILCPVFFPLGKFFEAPLHHQSSIRMSHLSWNFQRLLVIDKTDAIKERFLQKGTSFLRLPEKVAHCLNFCASLAMFFKSKIEEGKKKIPT